MTTGGDLWVLLVLVVVSVELVRVRVRVLVRVLVGVLLVSEEVVEVVDVVVRVLPPWPPSPLPLSELLVVLVDSPSVLVLLDEESPPSSVDVVDVDVVVVETVVEVGAEVIVSSALELDLREVLEAAVDPPSSSPSLPLLPVLGAWDEEASLLCELPEAVEAGSSSSLDVAERDACDDEPDDEAEPP